MSHRTNIALALGGAILAATAVFDTKAQDDTRGLKPREYAQQLGNRIVNSRPKSNRRGKLTSATYAADSSDTSVVTPGVDVGITFWRLRKIGKSDNIALAEQTRIVKRVKDKEVITTTTMIPERTSSGTSWSDGERFRLSIEAPFDSFIYIIDQEQYAGGIFSEPYLIFPSAADLNRNARGGPGKLVCVPAEPDCFEISSLNADGKKKTAEVLTILLSPKILDQLSPLSGDAENRKIDRALFEQLQRDWGGRAWRFENVATAGTPITKVEKTAYSSMGETLTDSDPEPQTVYHLARKAGDLLLITIPVSLNR